MTKNKKKAREAKKREAYRLSESYAYKDPSVIRNWLINVVVFESMLKQQIEDELFDDIHDSGADIAESRDWFAYKGHDGARLFAIMTVDEITSQRSSDFAQKIYRETRLKDIVTFNTAAFPLKLISKAYSILSESGDNPSRKLIKRINSLLEVFKEERLNRETSLEKIVERTIYLSLFPEYVVNEMESLGTSSLLDFQGGKRLVVRLNHGFDRSLSEGARVRWLRRLARGFRQRRRIRRYRKMGLYRLDLSEMTAEA